MKKAFIITYLALGILSAPVRAQNKAELPTLELSAEASRIAPNDLARARVSIELTDTAPTELAKQVNQRIAEALALAKSYPSVKTSSAGTQTFPLYGKSGVRIENWRMRSELALESKDILALSELVGKLQALMTVDQLVVMPSPETQQRASDDAMVDAIKAFQARAALAAQALGKHYHVKDVNVGSSASRSPQTYARRAAVTIDSSATPAPIEAGDSNVTVTVNGTVELVD